MSLWSYKILAPLVLPVSQYVYNSLLSECPLEDTDVTFRSYSGEKVPVLGKVYVPVKYACNDEKVLDLIVVQGKRR